MAGLMDSMRWKSEGEKAELRAKAAEDALKQDRKWGSGAEAERKANAIKRPKIPLAMEGSSVPESATRAAQKALGQAGHPSAWGQSAAGNISADSLKAVGGKAMGLLKGAGRSLGPLGAAYEGGSELNKMFGTGAWDRAQVAAEEGSTRRALKEDPELATRGAETADRIATQAMDGVRGLMSQGAPDEVVAQAAAEKAVPGPMEAEKKEQVDAVASQAPEIEAGRERIERGAYQGLKSGEVHVSELAEGVVSADAQRAGKELKPTEKEDAIKTEIKAMKTMDKEQLAKYVSYAVIAGGLLASALDKSGQAGQMFHESMNKQLDRNLTVNKLIAQQQQQATENALAARKQDATEKDIDSKIENRSGLLDQGAQRLLQGETGLGIQQQRADTADFSAKTQADIGRQRLGIMSEGNQIKREGIEAANARAQAKLAGAQDKGVPPTYKDSKEIVDNIYDATGSKADPGLRKAVAAKFPTAAKRYPDLSASELVELLESEYETESTSTWGGIGPTRTRIKKVE